MSGRSRSAHGFSLAEMAIAAAILATVSIPLIQVFLTSKQAIVRTDTRRDHRYYLTEIVAHAGRQPLHELWRDFGPGEAVGWNCRARCRKKFTKLFAMTSSVLYTASFPQRTPAQKAEPPGW